MYAYHQQVADCSTITGRLSIQYSDSWTNWLQFQNSDAISTLYLKLSKLFTYSDRSEWPTSRWTEYVHGCQVYIYR